ncbi:complement C1q-like protein 4 [Ruditapes philippinarum]|uniref:complement C1q-like protein 4 n=1 Tax=Ruditapes philippinarum TaxID=129788 RepID=UPI00295B7D71|nr:complement C1q-like protein 4 [Ruditapes philippinarum]
MSIAVVACLFLVAEVTAANIGDVVIPNKRHDTGHFVAFSAGRTTNLNLNKDDVVIYDKVWSNAGNGYDNTTGVFTCPVAGVYSFMYHGLSESAGTMSLDVYKNNDYQISAYAHNTADYAAASNALTVSLAVGDRVYVKGHGSSILYGRTDEVYSSFSGFLLLPTE